MGRLGAGGMAEVFLARLAEVRASGRSAQDDDTLVALKKMLPHLVHDRAFVSRFKREGTIAARLHHPAIARMHRAGRVGASRFIAMELVRGETLSRVLDRQRRRACPMPAVLVARVGAAVASALHWVHELNDEDGRPLHIVHRDVSPQNVMLGYDGSVKLIDFGVAHWVDSATRTGSIAGKVRYFSPEQVRGTSVDRRTDIYSLGVMLYEALLGDAVFSRETDLAVMQAILDSEPPEITDAPPPLRAALRRAMSKDPAARFSSAQELAEALIPETAADHEAIGMRYAAVAAYMQDLFPDGMQRWSKIVNRAAAGIPFEDDAPGSLERASITAETIPVTMPGDPPPVSLGGALGATVALPIMTGRIPWRRGPALAGLFGLTVICFMIVARRPSTVAPLPALPWVPVSASARAETPLAPVRFSPLDADGASSESLPPRSSTAPFPLRAGAADPRPRQVLQALRTAESRRSSSRASQAGQRRHRRRERGGRPSGPGSIADQLEPSPYAWSSR